MIALQPGMTRTKPRANEQIEILIGGGQSNRAACLREIDISFEAGKISQIEARALEAYTDRVHPA